MTAIKSTKKQIRENILNKIEAALKDVTVTAHQKKFAKKIKKASHLIADFVWETNSERSKKVVVKKAVKPVVKKKKVVKKAAKKSTV